MLNVYVWKYRTKKKNYKDATRNMKKKKQEEVRMETCERDENIINM